MTTTNQPLTWSFTNNTNKALIMTMLTANMSGGTDCGILNADSNCIQLIPQGANNNSPIIKANSTVTFLMNWTHSFSSGFTAPASSYPLQAITADKFIPVWTDVIMKDFTLNPAGFAPVTVGNSALTSFNETVSFLQQEEAYPNSQMSQDFQQALKTANSPSMAASGTVGGTANTINSTVNNFFAKQPNYSDVTYDSYLSAVGYNEQFPSLWNPGSSSNASTTTYYIYNTKPIVSGSTNYINYVGTLTINTPNSLDWTNNAGGISMSFDPAKYPGYLNPSDTSNEDDYSTIGQAIDLTYSKGKFITGVTDNTVSLSLQGIYMPESMLPGESNSTSTTIVTALTGSANGNSVVAFTTPVTSSSYNLKSWQEFLKNLGPIVEGALVMILLSKGIEKIGKMLKGKADAENETKLKNGEEPDGEKATTNENDIEQVNQETTKGVEQKAGKVEQKSKQKAITEQTNQATKDMANNATNNETAVKNAQEEASGVNEAQDKANSEEPKPKEEKPKIEEM